MLSPVITRLKPIMLDTSNSPQKWNDQRLGEAVFLTVALPHPSQNLRHLSHLNVISRLSSITTSLSAGHGRMHLLFLPILVGRAVPESPVSPSSSEVDRRK
jgi:hypothetical protein